MSLDFGMLAKLLVNAASGEGGGGGAAEEKREGFAWQVEEIPLIPRVVPEDLKPVGGGWDMQIDAATFVGIALGVVLGMLAVYLSWGCNTAMGYSTPVKAVFATFAFFFGLTYIVLYILLRWDVCRRVQGSVF